MSEIKTVGQTWMAKCNQLTALSFKWLRALANQHGRKSAVNLEANQNQDQSG